MAQDVKLAAPANSIGLAIWTHLIDGARVYLGPNADRIVIAPIVAARRHTVCRSLGANGSEREAAEGEQADSAVGGYSMCRGI